MIVLSAISTFMESPAAFFDSLGFFAIVALFFVNLTSCTLYRFTRERRKKSNRNFGPDILHGGLILFVIVALLSTFNRMEGKVSLVKGESVKLPGGSVLTLDNFEYSRYENGRPKDYISYLTIENDDSVIYSHFPLRVNHPLKLKGYTLYQLSYGEMKGGVFSVIQAVRDPFFELVIAAFIVSGIGIFITLFAKLKNTVKEKGK